MSYLKVPTTAIFFLIAFFVFIASSLNNGFPDSYAKILSATQDTNRFPAGEIVSGFYMKQAIDWDLVKNYKKVSSSPVCVSLLLANYYDRINQGVFKVTLRVEDNSYVIYMEAAEIRDNAFQHFCYEEATISDVVHKPASIILEGVDSPQGRAITAWLTSEIDGEGKNSKNSLIFSVGAKYEPAKQKIRAIVLIAICAVSGVLLFWPDLGSPKTALSAQDKKNIALH